jgi:hypothetical protein
VSAAGATIKPRPPQRQQARLYKPEQPQRNELRGNVDLLCLSGNKRKGLGAWQKAPEAFVAPAADTPWKRATAENIAQLDVYLLSLALVASLL